MHFEMFIKDDSLSHRDVGLGQRGEDDGVLVMVAVGGGDQRSLGCLVVS